jgi:hypothetical protein
MLARDTGRISYRKRASAPVAEVGFTRLLPPLLMTKSGKPDLVREGMLFRGML